MRAAKVDANSKEIIAAQPACKECYACKEIKLLSEFYSDKSRKDGVKCYCKSCYLLSIKTWKHRNAEKVKAQSKAYRENNREKIRNSAAKSRHKLKISLINRMGGKCCKCGFDDERAIQFDHINGDGFADRNKGFDWWRFLKTLSEMNNDVLFSRFQLLCANCNQIKRVVNSEYGNGKKSRRTICV